MYSPNRNYIHLGRLRLRLSPLNAHRRKYHFIENARCIFCPGNKEDTSHYLLQCPHYTAARTTMLNSLSIILPAGYQHLLNRNTKQYIKQLTQVLIFGIKDSNVDTEIF